LIVTVPNRSLIICETHAVGAGIFKASLPALAALCGRRDSPLRAGQADPDGRIF
jgi:hypothetical protein